MYGRKVTPESVRDRLVEEQTFRFDFEDVCLQSYMLLYQRRPIGLVCFQS